MSKKRLSFNLPIAVVVLAVTGGLLMAALGRLTIETDVVGSLPHDDPVLSDARYVVEHHPSQDQVVIDIEFGEDDLDRLVQGAQFVQTQLTRSGLFDRMPTDQIQQALPELLAIIVDHLPSLLTADDLAEQATALLAPENIRDRLRENLSRLFLLEGIGQADLIVKDPLGFRYIVLEKLSRQSPARGAKLHQGFLVSADERHVLLVVKPKGSGTDTRFARQITTVLASIAAKLNAEGPAAGAPFTLTPVGAYRAALDNETTAKGDIRRVILLATLGIFMLLVLAFPRPTIGLFALMPALVGTVVAIFVYALWHPSISILTLGFGGAIISITVDHGIAYLLFLDRPHKTTGRQAAREIWAVGLLAMLTSVGAFATLATSGFAILSQIGQFAAVGIAGSFLFVHTIFPKIFPKMPPAHTPRRLLLPSIIRKAARFGGKPALCGAAAFALGMLFFAKPVFNVDFREMNTVSRATRDAEVRLQRTWGNLFDRVFLLSSADSLEALQARGDDLAQMMEKDLGRGFFKAAFHPSMVLPGNRRGIENIAAWTAFWNEDRRSRLQQALAVVSAELGLKPEVFDSFSRLTTAAVHRSIEIPESVLPLLGIYRAAAKDGPGWIQFTHLVPGDGYRPEILYDRYTGNGLARLLDPAFFSFKLGDYLKQTFVRMFLIIGASVTCLILIFFWDLWLAATALAPIAFAVSATLGTLTLIGHPLDVPGLMLSIVILGMGIDYALFFMRAHQRYRDPAHPSVVMIRTAVFLAAASTLIGFGSLMTAEHRLLNSAGLTCFLGIFYSFLGTVLILPPLLERLFQPVATHGDDPIDDNTVRRRLWRRYRHMEALPRLQAYLQLRDDPFWKEIGKLPTGVRAAITIGTGSGLPLAWLLAVCPGVRIYAVEPHFERARVAALLIGQRGQVQCRPEPEFADPAGGADLVLLIDVIETLADDQLDRTLQRLRDVLNTDALGIIRICPGAPETWGATPIRRIVDLFQRRRPLYFRSPREVETRLRRNGYHLVDRRPSGDGRRGTWLFFRPQAR